MSKSSGIKLSPQQDHDSAFFFLHVFTVQRGNGPLAGSGDVVLRLFLSSLKIEDLGCVQLLSCKLLFKMAGRAYVYIYNMESQLKLPGIMLLLLICCPCLIVAWDEKQGILNSLSAPVHTSCSAALVVEFGITH